MAGIIIGDDHLLALAAARHANEIEKLVERAKWLRRSGDTVRIEELARVAQKRAEEAAKCAADARFAGKASENAQIASAFAKAAELRAQTIAELARGL